MIQKIFAFSCLFVSIVFSQSSSNEAMLGYQAHDGFAINLSLGLSIGSIEQSMKNLYASENYTWEGEGGAFHMKIGGAIVENHILSFDMYGRSILGPKLSSAGESIQANDKVSVGDSELGIGYTFYVMPMNVFIGAMVGVAKFTLEVDGDKFETEHGPAFALEVGKEWWVSENWGLGLKGGVLAAKAEDQSSGSFVGYEGELNTTRFYLLFSATFN